MAWQPFTVDHLLRLRRPTTRVPLHLSPDGALLALSAQPARRNTPAGGGQGFTAEGVLTEMVGSRVIVVDTGTGAIADPFTAPGSTSWGPQWSPDGRTLAAYVQQEGPVCLGAW